MMWQLLIVFIAAMVLPNSDAASRRGSYGYNGGNGAGAGSYAGTGSYGGYASDDYDDDGAGFGYSPEFGPGFIDPYLFHQQLTAQILSQHAAQNNALASTFSSGDATATAGAESLPNDILIQQQIAQQQAAAYDNYRRQSLYNNRGGGKGKPNRYAPNYASASGSVGPGGFYQTAFINPANPNNPNIVNRFSSSSGPSGFQGVATSSFSSSSDIDGKKTSHRSAQTSVNDNGKVTTYTVQS